MAPESAYQVYTVHGFVNGEGMPLAWAILPNKNTATYIEVFSALRQAVVRLCGDIGSIKYFVTDFVTAAINAIQQVFPTCCVKGCSFHYRQALLRRVHQEGLQSAYSDEGLVRQWIRHLMAMCLLPAFAIPHAWQFLRIPPVVEDSCTMQKMQRIAEYYSDIYAITAHTVL